MRLGPVADRFHTFRHAFVRLAVRPGRIRGAEGVLLLLPWGPQREAFLRLVHRLESAVQADGTASLADGVAAIEFDRGTFGATLEATLDGGVSGTFGERTDDVDRLVEVLQRSPGTVPR